MVIGNFNRLMLRGGLTLAAALMMTTAVFGQDQSGSGDDIVLYPSEIVVDDGLEIGVGGWPDDPVADGSDDGFDGGSGEGTGDGGTGDDGTYDGTYDGGTGDGGTYDGGVVDKGEVAIYDLDGGPVLCADCDVAIAGLPVEAYQSADAGPLAPGNAAPAAKPRAAAKHAVAAGAMADCLVLHPQLPWICGWQNGAGQ